MKTLFSFLKPYRKECVLAPLFKLLEGAAGAFRSFADGERLSIRASWPRTAVTSFQPRV